MGRHAFVAFLLFLFCGLSYSDRSLITEGIDYVEDLTKLVIIGSCVGVLDGLRGPEFECASFCDEYPSMRLEKVWLDDEYLTSGFLGVDDDAGRIVLMHRGTMSVKNLMLDFDTKLVPMKLAGNDDDDDDCGELLCEDCLVHKGFYRAYKSSFMGIIPELEQLANENPDYKLIIGGHSMGGSVATLTAAHLKALGYDLTLVSCGQPMVGNQEFSDWLDENFDSESSDVTQRDVLRLVRQYDPIPFYPTISEYQPASGEIFITTNRAAERKKSRLQKLFCRRTSEKYYYTCDGQKDDECSWGGRRGAELTIPGLPYTHPDYGPSGVYSSCVEF